MARYVFPAFDLDEVGDPGFSEKDMRSKILVSYPRKIHLGLYPRIFMLDTGAFARPDLYRHDTPQRLRNIENLAMYYGQFPENAFRLAPDVPTDNKQTLDNFFYYREKYDATAAPIFTYSEVLTDLFQFIRRVESAEWVAVKNPRHLFKRDEDLRDFYRTVCSTLKDRYACKIHILGVGGLWELPFLFENELMDTFDSVYYYTSAYESRAYLGRGAEKDYGEVTRWCHCPGCLSGLDDFRGNLGHNVYLLSRS